MGEHWVVTGAGSGIGRALAVRLAERSVDVTACVQTEKQRRALAMDLGAAASLKEILVFDVRNDAATRAAARESGRPVDVLVAAAAIYGSGSSWTETPMRESLAVLATNAIGPMITMRAYQHRLRLAERPRAIMISSELGSMQERTGSSHLSYRASKAALNKISQGLAAALSEEGVIVIALDPGWARTGIGGPEAPFAAEESASGIIEVASKLSAESSGRFFDFRGVELEW